MKMMMIVMMMMMMVMMMIVMMMMTMVKVVWNRVFGSRVNDFGRVGSGHGSV